MRAAPDPKPPPQASRAGPSSLDGGHYARETSRCRHDPSQYRLAWGSAPAGPTARPWPPTRPTSNRLTGKPPTPRRAAAGRPARRPCARPSAANLCPQRDSNKLPSCVADRSQAQKPGPDGNRHRAEAQTTQLKSRQPGLTRLVGARFAISRRQKRRTGRVPWRFAGWTRQESAPDNPVKDGRAAIDALFGPVYVRWNSRRLM
jgi:hypothetical protein